MKAPYAAGAAMRAAASYRNADPLVGRLQSVCISLSRVLDALDAAIAADQERRFEDEWEAVRTAIGIIQTLDRTLDMESLGARLPDRFGTRTKIPSVRFTPWFALPMAPKVTGAFVTVWLNCGRPGARSGQRR